jgi:hypothetical protein
MADWSRRRIDVLALTTLRELAGRTNVALAVVFTAPEGVPWKPSQGPDGGPEPSITSVLQVPMLGSVVAQGFFGSLSEDQKHLVEKRFPGRTAVWSRTS